MLNYLLVSQLDVHPLPADVDVVLCMVREKKEIIIIIKQVNHLSGAVGIA
jgi:hypothetical protein